MANRQVRVAHKDTSKDLGIQASGGTRRRVQVGEGRRRKAGSRTDPASKLRACLARAEKYRVRRYWRTNASSVALYGTAATGHSKRATHDVRRQAARLVCDFHCQCIYSAVALGYPFVADSIYVHCLQLIPMWIAYRRRANSDDGIRITRAWRMAHRRLQLTKTTWNAVNGPVTSLMYHLRLLSWDVHLPNHWRSHDA